MSDMRDQQWQHVRMIAKLINWAEANGYELTWADAYRNPKFANVLGYYHEWSYHCKRLAVDLNLFKDGVLLTKSEDYKPLADYWESIGGSAGIRWNDGDHFSLGEGKIKYGLPVNPNLESKK